jgi:hypothetical protein
MKFNVQVRADVPNTFAKKNGEKVQERLLTCIDLTPDAMVADSFEVLASNLPFNEAGRWWARLRSCTSPTWWPAMSGSGCKGRYSRLRPRSK